MRLHTYVVRYDSGFAPNPFFGFCTLATCKPDIRRSAQLGDWVVGTGSADKTVNRGGFLVYLMRITETMPFQDYWADLRFQLKKPNLHGSKKHLCGDNIYSWDATTNSWHQLDSFHRNKDGSPNQRHIARDTGTNHVLISDDFAYFGAKGPKVPKAFAAICKKGRGLKIVTDAKLIADFVDWARTLGRWGFKGVPYDWATMP